MLMNLYILNMDCFLCDHSICLQVRWQTPDQDVNMEKI